MKKISQLFLLLLISSTTFGQFPSKAFKGNQTRSNKSSLAKLRTATSNPQTLDSIISQYDKNVFTYDAQGNVLLEIYSEWISATDSWGIYSKSEYTYDANGNVILYLDYRVDAYTNSVEDIYKYVYTYDANNNNISEIEFEWDDATGTWLERYKIESEFNSNKMITETVNFYWSNSQWSGGETTEYTYDAYDLLLDKTTTTSFGLITSVETYTYDANGNNILKMIDRYNGTELYSDRKEEYVYDVNGYQTLSEEFSWNTQSNMWVLTYKKETEYDLQGNPTQVVYTNWDISTSMVTYNSKNTFTYDLDFTTSNLNAPIDIKEISNNIITEVSTYYYEDGNWELEDDYVLYYTDGTTTATKSNTSKTALLVYPNPASGNGTITFSSTTVTEAQLQLMDVQGNMVYNKSIEMNQPISMNGLKEGIYFYYVTDASAATFKGSIVINK